MGTRDGKRRNEGNDGGERRYQHPIPSRDEIIVTMEAACEPLALKELAAKVDIHTEPHRNALENRLKAMVRDGQLIRNRAREYCLADHLDLAMGRVICHRDGYGFVHPDDGADDIYLPPREMRAVWDGDRVAVRVSTGRDGRREGRVAEILERRKTTLVGRFCRESGIEYVLEDGESRAEVLIAKGKRGSAKVGDLVQVEIVQYPTQRNPAVGRVIRVVGRGNDPGIETEVAILSHGIPDEWPAAIATAVGKLPTTVSTVAKRDREDLRELPLVTIDGADAKDFDDAVYCDSHADGWRLIVAIADVSHYVTPDTPLDREAQARGTSVYFPDRVVPMLPEELSNGLCSLNPHVDRLCLACEMIVSRQGAVKRSRFFSAVMRSAARLTYTQSAEILADTDTDTDAGAGGKDGMGGASEAADGSKPKTRRKRSGGAARDTSRTQQTDSDEHRHLRPHLVNLRQVYRAFVAARRRRGSIDFDLPQNKIELDDHGKVRAVLPVERLETHRLIEECMIAANVEAARRLGKLRVPALYRVHEGPEAERLDELRLFLGTFGFKLPPAGKLAPRDLGRIVQGVAGTPEAELIETVVLRSMKQARYQPKNTGHFGLGLAAYAHFTSPIRRYPDLLVHRAIKWTLEHGSAKGFPYTIPEMDEFGERCSRSERRANEAVWDVEEQLKCQFMASRIGEQFKAVVSGVVSFGLFMRIPELNVDGLVHVSALPADYYHRDPTGTRLVGERTGRTYCLADALEVRLARVDVDDRKIDFALLEDTRAPAARPRRGRKRHD